MTETLRHRGPDDEGYVAIDAVSRRAVPLAGEDTPARCRSAAFPFLPAGEPPPDGAGVVLAARRLAILDLSPGGHQPLSSPDGRDWIVHNGEIYNYVELRDELLARGHRFAGTSDTEVALAAYREWDTGCFERFNGMWAQAVWDGTRGRLVLARDRFGVKPLYVVEAGDGIAFASEIKALLEAGLAETRPNQPVLGRFLDTGRIDAVAGQTCFADVRQVEAGTFVEYDLGGALRPTRYYSPHAGEPLPGVVDERVRELLDDAVRLRLRSDVPVGSCLSGGLDSSAIGAFAQRRLARSGAQLESFTFAAGDPRHDERIYAQAVADATGAKPQFTTEPDDLPAAVEAVSREQDEPFGSASVVAQRQVMALAREHGTKVLLDGQGGDEVLAGYKYYVAARLADELGGGHPVRWWRHLAAARRNALLPTRWLLRATAGELRRRGRERLRDRQVEDVRDHLPALLHYEDRNSMAFSIETRLPFLDYRFVELGLALPGEAKIDDGWTKLTLRRALEHDLPALVVWRRDKIQFSVPQDAWLTGPLHELTSDLFASAAFAAREGVDAVSLRDRLARGALSAVEADLIWRHLSLELWYRAYVDSPRTRVEPLAAGR